MDITCPHCGEISGYELGKSYKGNVSCPWCPNTFYVEVENEQVKAVKKEPQK